MKEILRFTASWCSPCKMLAANLEKVSTDVPVKVVDIDVLTEVAGEYNIRSVPTLVMVENGVEVSRLIGVKTVEQIDQWITIN